MSRPVPVNILLVDDHPENLTALEAVLADLGQTLVRATSGREALRCLLQQDFAVILLDVQMPEMDGFETAALIRARDRSRRTPIIFITALERSEARVFQGYETGAVDYLFKPINALILRAKVRTFVELYQTTLALVASEAELRRINEHLERQVAERTAQITQREAHIRLILQAMGDGMYGFDLDGRITFANPAAAAMLGYAPDELLGRPQIDISHHPAFSTAQAAATLAVMFHEQETFFANDKVFWRKSGDALPVEYTLAAVRDGGRLTGAVVVFRDITARQLADQAMRESNQRFLTVFQQSPVGMVLVRLSDDRLVEVNAAWLRLLSFERGDVLGSTALALGIFANPEDRARLLDNFRVRGQATDFETTLRRKTGELRVVLISLERVDLNAEPTLLIQVVDITDRKLAAEAVHESNQRFTQIAANIQEVFWMFDHRQQRIVYVSPAYEAIWGRTTQSLYRDSRNYIEAIHPDDRPPMFAALEQQARGAPTDLEYRVLRPDGTERWIFDRSFPVLDESGQVMRTAGIAADITQRKQAEAALVAERASLAQRVAERTADLSRANGELAQAVRTKDEFLANMSHELRTPLNAILAFSEGLLEQVRGPLNERQQTSVRHIEASGRHLLALINDILDLSKMEAGRLELHRETTSLLDLCQASLVFIKETAAKKQLQVVFQPSALPRRTIEADARRLKQMLVNLLSNAVKFTPAGGQVSLTVTAADGVIRFAVCDTGIGMAPDDLARLFQPFTQLDSSLSRQHEGTGLGLALVRRLANLHGGSVTVESVLGQGSCFTLALPDPIVDVLPDRVTPAANGEAVRSASVIKPSDSAADQIVRYLGELQISAAVHPASETALAQTIDLQPGVIFLDWRPPDLSGWEVLAQLKADPRVREIPVIIIAAVDEPARGLAAGAAAYLVKPITRESLRQALSTVLAPPLAGRPALVLTPGVLPAAASVRLLLVEDNEANILAFSDYLQANQCQVVVARNGREALDRAAEWRPDVILMDIQMPQMNGLEAIRQLRTQPALTATPVIALTALAMPGDRERCLEAGATEYLTKPIRLKHLLTMIERLLAVRAGATPP